VFVCAELTPVAIMAGRMLARRLMAGVPRRPAEGDTEGTAAAAPAPPRVEYMDYKKIATTVFTPLELGTVGLSEEDAIAEYGDSSVDSYISSFTPLEMSLLHLEGNPCLAKVVVNTDTGLVLGMHIAAPNAGEIIQGFGAALKKGITYDELMTVVGIHPTVAEEFVTLSVSKKSGVDANKSGC
jgi:thioredoxin reductase (NADPH)